MPETAQLRAGAPVSLRPRISVPAQARDVLVRVTPVTVASWALGGFYFSLMRALVRVATRPTIHLTTRKFCSKDRGHSTDERAGLLAAFYVEGYLSFSLPAVLTGLAVPMVGLAVAAYVYGTAIIVMALPSMIAVRFSRH